MQHYYTCYRNRENIKYKIYKVDVLGASVLPNQNRGIELSGLNVEPIELVIDRSNDEPNSLRVILIGSKPTCNEKYYTISLVTEATLHRIY